MSDKIDGRKGNGGSRKGAGRKKKADELKVSQYGTAAIIKVYGSIENYYAFIAKQAQAGSFQHLNLLQQYVFGKPTDVIEVNDVSENKPMTILKFKNYTEVEEDTEDTEEA